MIYITLEEIIRYHAMLVKKYGGIEGIRDLGLLASAIDMPKATLFGEHLHPTIFDKAAAYLFHIINNHPFVDGNKRTGTLAALFFLRLNQMEIHLTDDQSAALEELAVETAQNKTTKQLIATFFKECCLETQPSGMRDRE